MQLFTTAQSSVQTFYQGFKMIATTLVFLLSISVSQVRFLISFSWYLLTLCQVSSHGAVVSPRPRNALDGRLQPWTGHIWQIFMQFFPQFDGWMIQVAFPRLYLLCPTLVVVTGNFSSGEQLLFDIINDYLFLLISNFLSLAIVFSLV